MYISSPACLSESRLLSALRSALKGHSPKLQLHRKTHNNSPAPVRRRLGTATTDSVPSAKLNPYSRSMLCCNSDFSRVFTRRMISDFSRVFTRRMISDRTCGFTRRMISDFSCVFTRPMISECFYKAYDFRLYMCFYTAYDLRLCICFYTAYDLRLVFLHGV